MVTFIFYFWFWFFWSITAVKVKLAWEMHPPRLLRLALKNEKDTSSLERYVCAYIRLIDRYVTCDIFDNKFLPRR